MLRKLTIRNFKAIQDMTIEFTPLTILIGENSCSKSTILQALDFLRSAAGRDIPEYLREKDWHFEELKCQFNGGKEKPIEFVSTWDVYVEDHLETMEWYFSADFNGMWLNKEKLINCFNSETLLSYHNDGQENIPELYGQLNLQSSVLKYIDGRGMIKEPFFFMSKSINFELLSPEKMRSGNKLTYTLSIGAGGEALAYCIDRMNISERQELDKTVSALVDSNIEVKTSDLGKKVEFWLNCKIADDTVYIDSKHISDGLLRIIAFTAISIACKKDIMDTPGMLLLDEIENGINPYLTGQVILLLRELVEREEQLVLTTHSPVILNDFKPEEIVFLWKDKNESVCGKKMFYTDEMQALLSALNPGEVWINLEKEDILERLFPKKEVRNENNSML
jgi:predicted ATPase